MKAKKQHSDLIPEVPPAPASTPTGALQFAREQPTIERVHASEYVPAMLELVAKGYDVQEAASRFTGNGCPCSSADLIKVFLERMGRVAWKIG